MKWFKHLCNANKGSSLQDLYAEFGINQGHGLYFRLVEFLADKWDGKSEPRFRFLAEILRSHMALPPKKFGNFLEILKRDEANAISLSGKFVEIYFPKLLEVRHRDSLDASTRLEISQHKNGGEEKKNKKRIEEKRDRESAAEPLHPLAEIWNSNCGDLSKVLKSNKARNKKAEIRWPENNQDEWTSIVKRIAASDFCNGKSDRGWKATFDWLLQPDTHLKVSEGKYDNHSGGQNASMSDAEYDAKIAAIFSKEGA